MNSAIKIKEVRLKRIMQLSETSEPGGSETVLLNIAQKFNGDSYQTIACLLEEGWLTERLDDIGIKYHLLNSKTTYDYKCLMELIKLIKRQKIRLVHAHDFWANVYGSVAAKLAGIPMIGTIHGKGYFTEKRNRQLAYKMAIWLCSNMIAVSEDLKSYLIDALNLKNPRKLITLYNGIDTDKYSPSGKPGDFRQIFKVDPDTPVVGTVGSLFEVKGLDYLIEAIDIVIKQYPEFKLFIVGEGYAESSLKQKIESMKLQDSVIMLGFREDVPDLLRFFDIYVCSSLSEGMSLSILEAMSSGKPVIATNVGGNPELVSSDKNGFLVPSKNPGALAEKILLLLKNKALRSSMGSESRLIAEQKFSLQQMISNYEDLYNRLIK